MSTEAIDASDGTSLIPVGTVLGYKTNTGLYGTLRINNIDPDLNHQLTITIVTFNGDGSVAVSRSALIINGTWNAELDTGVEADAEDTLNYDFNWGLYNDTSRGLIPENTALFTIMMGGEV